MKKVIILITLLAIIAVVTSVGDVPGGARLPAVVDRSSQPGISDQVVFVGEAADIADSREMIIPRSTRSWGLSYFRCLKLFMEGNKVVYRFFR
jgi:hypothetical protein